MFYANEPGFRLAKDILIFCVVASSMRVLSVEEALVVAVFVVVNVVNFVAGAAAAAGVAAVVVGFAAHVARSSPPLRVASSFFVE